MQYSVILYKLFVSLAALYLFYIVFLQRITFFGFVRIYFLLGTIISIFISTIQVSLDHVQNTPTILYTSIQKIPSINAVENNKIIEQTIMPSISLSTILTYIIIVGILVFTIRLLIQLISLHQLTRTRILYERRGKVNIFNLIKETGPFSIGNNIYINVAGTEAEDYEDIILHELAHSHQKHTIDCIWMEILCITQWYNPFAWLLRKSVRNNLEYIADDVVLRHQVNKKQYQYLLLRTMTTNNITSITNNFNLSSLKKRITMMNKIKSSKLHFLKLLIIVPVAAILLVSFHHQNIDIAGVVIDVNSNVPLKDVTVTCRDSHTSTKTDKNGFYRLIIPANGDKDSTFKIWFTNKGYDTLAHPTSVAIGEYQLINAGISSNSHNKTGFTSSGNIASDKKYEYDDAIKNLKEFSIAQKQWNDLTVSNKVIKKTDKNYIYIKCHGDYNCGGLGLHNNELPKIFIDNKLSSIEEVNARYTPNDISNYKLHGDTLSLFTLRNK